MKNRNLTSIGLKVDQCTTGAFRRYREQKEIKLRKLGYGRSLSMSMCAAIIVTEELKRSGFLSGDHSQTEIFNDCDLDGQNESLIESLESELVAQKECTDDYDRINKDLHKAHDAANVRIKELEQKIISLVMESK